MLLLFNCFPSLQLVAASAFGGSARSSGCSFGWCCFGCFALAAAALAAAAAASAPLKTRVEKRARLPRKRESTTQLAFVRVSIVLHSRLETRRSQLAILSLFLRSFGRDSAIRTTSQLRTFARAVSRVAISGSKFCFAHSLVRSFVR